MPVKAHNPSGRIVRGRIACVVVLFCTGLGAASAHAAAPLTGAIGSVTTTGASAAGALAPVEGAAAQALSPPPNPAGNAAAVPAVALAALGKAPLPNAAAAGATPPARVATQSAAAAVAPLVNAATQRAGHVVEPVSKVATRVLAPTLGGAVRVLTPTSGLIHRATSSLPAAGDVLTTAIVSAAGSVAGTLTPLSRAAGKIISAPQGAPAALRGATGAIGALGGGAPWGSSSAPLSRTLELLGSSLPTLLDPRGGKGAPRTLAQSLPAAVLSTLLGAPAGGGPRA